MPKKIFPAIPEPIPTIESLLLSVQVMKQGIEIITAQKKGTVLTSGVTWQDLVDLGLIELSQVPND